MIRTHRILTLAIAASLTFVGCGEPNKNVWVTGKLLKGGVNYVVPEGQRVAVTFVGLEFADPAHKTSPGDESFVADLDPKNMTFTVPGNQGQGIPAGKYRVAVTQKMTREAFNAAYPKPTKGVDREMDMLKGQFGPGTSAIFREVKGNENFVIDLEKPNN
jgi:hypothetical protein